MPNSLLGILEVLLIALMWLFFLRAMRAVWVEVRRAKADSSPLSLTGSGLAPPIRSGAMVVPASHLQAPSSVPGPADRPSLVRLEVVDPQHGRVYDLDGEAVIGRAAGCAVSMEEDTYISHQHARIFRRGEETWIEDLGSTNGTFVNSRKLNSPVPMRMGDRVQVGRTQFKVVK